MILTAIYQMLSTGEQWTPSDLYKIDMPVGLVEKQKAMKLLLCEGILSKIAISFLIPPDRPKTNGSYDSVSFLLLFQVKKRSWINNFHSFLYHQWEKFFHY